MTVISGIFFSIRSKKLLLAILTKILSHLQINPLRFLTTLLKNVNIENVVDERARKFFGGKITGFIDGPKENDVAFNYDKAQFTDDTGQALVLLDSLKATDYKPDAADIAKRMLEWAEKENAFENNILGPTSKVALANFRDGVDASAITNKALSNGSSMRIAPIGCLFTPDQRT